MNDINVDFHTHTSYVDDGESSVAEIIDAANEKGLEKIAITEHVRRDSPWVKKYVADVLCGRENSDAAVVLGFETKLLDMEGSLDISPDAKDAAELIICSLHRIPTIHPMEGKITIAEMDPVNTKVVYMDALKAICRNKSVDVIGHPFDLLYKHNVQLPDDEEMHGLAKYIASHGKAVEINTNYHVPSLEFIGICRQYGVKFSIGSDAHNAKRVGDTCWAVETLHAAGGRKNDMMEMCLT